MVANHGLHQQHQGRDEQLSEKSEGTIASTPARIEDIFEWIEGIPLSKTTKHLARDFSDAVLMAEILKFYYPHLVSPHNYIPANSVQGKKDNWNTLNRKVLSKIEMQLCPETIDQLSHSQCGVIDRILVEFRDKQMALGTKETEAMHVEEANNQEPHGQLEDNTKLNRSFTVLQPTVVKQPEESVQEMEREERPSIVARCSTAVKNFFIAIFSIVTTIVCFWRWFSRTPQPEPVEVEMRTVELEHQEKHNEHTVPDLDGGSSTGDLRDSYNQAVQEIRVKSEVIKTLCHKVAFLEGTMKLKDLKIATLNSQLELHRAPSSARASIVSATSSSNAQQQRIGSATRRRPRTQM